MSGKSRRARRDGGVSMVVLSLCMLFGVATFVSAENPTAQATKPIILEVTYDRAIDLVSIQACQIPLIAILREVSKKAQMAFDFPNEELLAEPVCVEISRVSPEEALKKLLREFDSASIYSSYSSTPASGKSDESEAPRLVKVVIFSKKARVSSGSHASKEEPLTERESRSGIEKASVSSSASARKDASKAGDPSGIDLRSTDSGSAPSQPAPKVWVNIPMMELSLAVSDLRQKGETAKLMELLLDRVQDPDREIQMLAFGSLAELAEPRVSQILTDVVQNGSDLASRHMAAIGLATRAKRGEVEGIGALYQALNDPDPDARSMFLLALGTLREHALPALAGAVHDSDPKVSAIARKILTDITGGSPGPYSLEKRRQLQ